MNSFALRRATQLGFQALIFVALLCGMHGGQLRAQEAVALEHRWEIDPKTDAVWNMAFPEMPEDVSLNRLAAPISEYRLIEARQVVEGSHLLSDSKREAARAAVLKLLREGETNRQIRQAQVSAWCKLFEAAEAAEVWSLIKDDTAIRGFVERELIEHKSDVAKTAWLARLADPKADPRELLLAIEGVGACGIIEARQTLENLVRSDLIFLPTRIVAARSLGSLVDEGLEGLANELLASNRTAKEQLAASLLARHGSPASETVMATVLGSSFSPAVVLAFHWYADHRAEQAKELAAKMLKHSDNSIRLLAAKVLNRYEDEDSLRLQSRLLSDRNVTLRRTIRDHLIKKAESELLLPVVDEALTAHLSGEAFEGIEQAILVAVALNEKHRCPQMLLLLDHPRPEVNIRAAWALQELADDPVVLAEIHKYCQKWTDVIASRSGFQSTDINRIAFLLEAIGRNAYEPADEMLRVYVPKQSQKMQPLTRTAAIWALGHIWQGRNDSGLESALIQRLLDMSTDDPEDNCVKYASALALGMFGNKSSIETLKTAPYDASDAIGVGIAWALEQIGPE